MVRNSEPKCSDSEDNLTFSDCSDHSDSEEELIHSRNLFDDDIDSDSAPDEVAFKDEKEKSVLSRKRTAAQLKEQKDLVKKKRREIHARNASQKTEKLKRLSEKMPSEIQEFLSILSKADPSNAKPEKDVSEAEAGEKNEDGPLEENIENETKKAEEFIRLHGSTVFKVKNIKKEVKKPSLMSIEAANFREKALFGSKIRREPTRNLLAKLEKQRVGGKR